MLEEQGLSLDKVSQTITQLLDKADSLEKQPYKGQYETYLEHLGKGHRRLVEGNHKIIYRIEGQSIYITDFFDTRQDSEKMKG